MLFDFLDDRTIERLLTDSMRVASCFLLIETPLRLWAFAVREILRACRSISYPFIIRSSFEGPEYFHSEMHTILKLYVAFFLATSVPARLWDGPLQTAPNLGVANQWGWNPAPTAAPSPLELAKRQNQLTPLCGYIAGNLCRP